MATRESPVLYFQELAIDDQWVSPRRTITESDVVSFACLSGDFNPIHVDRVHASETPFRRPIAHGLLVMSIASGLTSTHPRIATIAFLGIHQWSFLEPVFFGDTIHVETRVTSLEPRPRGKRGIVTWSRRILNQDGTMVQEGLTRTLVQGRSEGRSGRDSG